MLALSLFVALHELSLISCMCSECALQSHLLFHVLVCAANVLSTGSGPSSMLLRWLCDRGGMIGFFPMRMCYHLNSLAVFVTVCFRGTLTPDVACLTV